MFIKLNRYRELTSPNLWSLEPILINPEKIELIKVGEERGSLIVMSRGNILVENDVTEIEKTMEALGIRVAMKCTPCQGQF
jgi:hypothetical protein